MKILKQNPKWWKRVDTVLTPQIAGDDISLKDDNKLFFDTAEVESLEYSSAHGCMLFNSAIGYIGSTAEFAIYSHTAADANGTWDPAILFKPDGEVEITNTAQGNVGNRRLTVRMEGGLHLIAGTQPATVKTTNLSTNRNYEFPNIAGTLVTTAGAVADVNLGAYILKVGSAANYTEIKADGEINLHGTARVTRHLRVGAGQWSHGASAPSAGIDGVFPYMAFDAASDDECHYTVIVPHRLDLTVDVEFVIDWYYTGSQDNGTVCWGLEYKSIKAGEAITGAGTTITKVSAGTHTTGQMVRTVFTTKILAANLECCDTFGLRLYRDVSADTLAVDARLLSTHFHFTQNSLGKST